MSRGFAKNLTKHHLNIVTNSWRRADEWDYGNIKRLKELKEIFFLCSKNKQKSQRQSRGWDSFLCYYLQQFIFLFTAFEHSKLVKDISKWIHSLPFVCLPSTTFFFFCVFHWWWFTWKGTKNLRRGNLFTQEISSSLIFFACVW